MPTGPHPSLTAGQKCISSFPSLAFCPDNFSCLHLPEPPCMTLSLRETTRPSGGVPLPLSGLETLWSVSRSHGKTHFTSLPSPRDDLPGLPVVQCQSHYFIDFVQVSSVLWPNDKHHPHYTILARSKSLFDFPQSFQNNTIEKGDPFQ